MPITPVTTFRLRPDDRKLLAGLARRLKKSKAETIRLLIRRGMAEPLGELLSKEELRALNEFAGREMRDPRLQATLIIRQKLEFEGFIEAMDPT